MGLKKLIKNLQKSLSAEAGKKHVSRDRIDELLGELEKKEKKLCRKLSKEKNARKRKDLKLQLKIVSTQRKKGTARLHELEKKSH